MTPAKNEQRRESRNLYKITLIGYENLIFYQKYQTKREIPRLVALLIFRRVFLACEFDGQVATLARYYAAPLARNDERPQARPSSSRLWGDRGRGGVRVWQIDNTAFIV